MNPTSSFLARTEKLFENNQDGYIYDFEATVIDCFPIGEKFALELDRTAFFPEGGGQSADEGEIDGIKVDDVKIVDGKILHLLEKAIPTGTVISEQIDSALRFKRMQNHSGEHIVSGLLHSTYGIENVGFHMSQNEMTIDTSAPLTEEMIESIERAANRAVFENRAIKTYYPSKDELSALEYRSKTELSDDVRIVEIDGIDKCACCAPHVRFTGEIGVIHIKSFIKYKKGTRLTLACGSDALDYYISLSKTATLMSRELSAPIEELFSALKAKQGQLSKTLGALSEAKEKILDMRLASIESTEQSICVFEDGCDAGLLRKLVNKGVSLTSGVFAAFSKKDDGSYLYVIGTKEGDLSPLAKDISQALGGRGGGKGTMITGFVESDEEKIKEYFKKTV